MSNELRSGEGISVQNGTPFSDRRILDAVHRITRTLSTTVDQAEGLRRTLEVAARCVDAEGGTIWQHSPERHELVCRHVVGERAGELVGFALGESQGVAGQVFQSGKSRSDADLSQNPQHARWVDEQIRHETRSMVTVPLCYPEGTPFGVLQLINKRRGSFTSEDVTVLEIVAGIAAMSIHNAELAQQALRTEALNYVAGFAHDIYNRIASFVTGLPTLRLILDDGFAHVSGSTSSEAAGSIRSEAFELVDFMEQDADMVYRYARFIARLARDLPLDTHFEDANLVETANAQVLQLRPKAREMEVELGVEGDQPVVCSHDRLLVGSAIYNLLHNALPETRRGKVTVAIRQEDGAAILEVRDTG